MRICGAAAGFFGDSGSFSCSCMRPASGTIGTGCASATVAAAANMKNHIPRAPSADDANIKSLSPPTNRIDINGVTAVLDVLIHHHSSMLAFADRQTTLANEWLEKFDRAL